MQPPASAERPPNVTEFVNTRKTGDDPAVKEERVVLSPPPAPEEFQHEGSFSLMAQTHWVADPEFELKPQESHHTSVSIGEPSLLLVRASWRGSTGPVKLLVKKDTTDIVTAKTTTLPPDRGTADGRAEIKVPGAANVIFANGSNAPLQVRIVVGTIPLSMSGRSQP